MIKKELHMRRSDGVKLYRSYSDRDMMIRQDQTGNEYSEAIDVENAPYTYTETNKPIEDKTGELTVDDALEILNEFGVDTDDN